MLAVTTTTGAKSLLISAMERCMLWLQLQHLVWASTFRPSLL
jgi:hypothetical protein